MALTGKLVPTDDATVRLLATADRVKPIVAYADPLVSEFKLHADADGLRYNLRDPANVTQIGMNVPAEAFDEFDADETTIGVDTGRVLNALRAGRKRQRDSVQVSYADEYLTTEVQREYDGMHMDLRNRIATIDPDAIRGEPDPLEDQWSDVGTVPRNALEDAITAGNVVADYVTLKSNGGDLEVHAAGDTNDAAAVMNDVMTGEGLCESYLSLDYLTDMLTALTTVGAEEVTIQIADDYPVRFGWEREWNDATVEGFWTQAPRIGSESDI